MKNEQIPIPESVMQIKLPSTSDLFKKHFNDMGGVGLFHPNMEKFFDDLNNVCLIEAAIKKISDAPK